MCPTLNQTLTDDIFSRHKNIVEMSLLKRHDILSLSSFFDFKIYLICAALCSKILDVCKICLRKGMKRYFC